MGLLPLAQGYGSIPPGARTVVRRWLFTLHLGVWGWLLHHRRRKVMVLVCPSCLKSALPWQDRLSSPCQEGFVCALSFIFLIE